MALPLDLRYNYGTTKTTLAVLATPQGASKPVWRSTVSNPTQLPLFESIAIPLTRGCITYVDPIDADFLSMKWYVCARKHTSYAHHQKMIEGKKITFLLHRLILARALGRELKDKEVVDHINGNGLDNRRSNLRLATQGQNVINSRLHSNNTTGYKGVSWHKKAKKWSAAIRLNGHSFYLGLFVTPEDARDAYTEASVRLHGDFATTRGEQ